MICIFNNNILVKEKCVFSTKCKSSLISIQGIIERIFVLMFFTEKLIKNIETKVK